MDQLRAAIEDRYAVEREIGAGGMATVYLARDLRHGRLVALKVLRPELGAVLGAERFFAEIRVTASLQHPNLLPLFDSGEAGGQLFYVMPFVEGETLRARLDRETQLPVDDVVRLTAALASALDYAHARGVVHRDLKPENILLQSGQPMIADFGIALAVANSGGARITQTGLSLGTPQYMSPEQATGEKGVDARSDQYSLAAVVYEMLTGEPPHSGPSAQAIIARLMTEKPRAVRSTRESVPPAADAAILRALSKLPADRFASCGDFAAALAAAVRTPTSAIPVAAPVERTASRGKLAMAAAAVVLLAAGGWYATRGRSSTPGSLDSRRVYVSDPTGVTSGLEATASAVNDALLRGIGDLPWAKVSSPASSEASNRDPVAAARRAGAATVLTTAVVAAGDSAQLQVRLLDAATAGVIRAMPTVRIARNASPEAVQAATTQAVMAVGFASNPSLGPGTLPSGNLPDMTTFRMFESAMQDFVRPDTLSRNRMLATMRAAVARDPSFRLARLMLAFAYGYWTIASRDASVTAYADTVRSWATAQRSQLSPFEGALADFALSATTSFNEAGVTAARALRTLAPNSAVSRALPEILLDLNRPAESQAVMEEVVKQKGDSAPKVVRLRIAEVRHYLGDFKGALSWCREFRRLYPQDAEGMRCELGALAALGDSAAIMPLLDEVASAPPNDGMYGFAGDILNSTGNELRAHGHPTLSRQVTARALAWFDANGSATAQNYNIALRKGMTLEAVGRPDEALAFLRDLSRQYPADVRAHGFIARLCADKGDSSGVAREVAWLKAVPPEKLQGAPTYELATIEAHLGPAHRDAAVNLLVQSLRQGQGWAILRRLHWFKDWDPLRDYPPFVNAIKPRG